MIQRIGDSLWQAMPEGTEKYNAYLCSREWSMLKEAVKRRSGGVCERCHVNPSENVHHLTYIRRYKERLEDLAAWCRACHEFTHGKSDRDPREAYVTTMAARGPLTLGRVLGDASLVECPECGSENCHIESCQDEGAGEFNQGLIRIHLYGECPHKWDLCIGGHKGTLVAFTENCREVNSEL
jgi:hypothetical protein